LLGLTGQPFWDSAVILRGTERSRLVGSAKEKLKSVDTIKTESRKKAQEDALLSIRVLDDSCGSGHILLSAARRIATELARVRPAIARGFS
jgi:hypothetical protein